MIQTFEDKLKELKSSISDLIKDDVYVFRKKITFRETPHSPTKYIKSVSKVELENYSVDELYSIKQRLKSEQ